MWVNDIKPNMGTSFLKLSRTAADCAKINVAVSVLIEKESIKQVKIALGAVAPTTLRATRAEQMLVNQMVTDEIITSAAETASEEATPISDVRSTSTYRAKMTKVLVKRAVSVAVERSIAQSQW